MSLEWFCFGGVLLLLAAAGVLIFFSLRGYTVPESLTEFDRETHGSAETDE